jgi:AcrR family transcriptional regulator
MTNRVPPRERILAAAAELFADSGIRAVGVDAIIARAGVAKASFYRHFPSKVELVVAWLRSPAARWLDPVMEAVADRSSSADDRLDRFLAVLGEVVSEPGFPGCAYLNTAAELHDAPPQVREVVVGFALELRDRLTDLVADAGVDDPTLVAELRLAVAGAMATTSLLDDGGTAAVEGLEALRLRLPAA